MNTAYCRVGAGRAFVALPAVQVGRVLVSGSPGRCVQYCASETLAPPPRRFAPTADALYYWTLDRSALDLLEETAVVDHKHFAVRLAPAAGTRLTLRPRRYANQPTLAFPWV